MSDVTFNPYWKMPASIVERDIIPHYLADPAYLRKMQIRVFDGITGDYGITDYGDSAFN